MPMPFREPECTVTREEIEEQVERVCRLVREMAAAAVRIAFDGATAHQLGGRQAANGTRISADLALDDLRSMIEEALRGRARATGYADPMSVQAAWTARLEANAAAERAYLAAEVATPSPLRVAMRAVDATPDDAPLAAFARVHGAAIADGLPAYEVA